MPVVNFEQALMRSSEPEIKTISYSERKDGKVQGCHSQVFLRVAHPRVCIYVFSNEVWLR